MTGKKSKSLLKGGAIVLALAIVLGVVYLGLSGTKNTQKTPAEKNPVSDNIPPPASPLEDGVPLNTSQKSIQDSHSAQGSYLNKETIGGVILVVAGAIYLYRIMVFGIAIVIGMGALLSGGLATIGGGGKALYACFCTHNKEERSIGMDWIKSGLLGVVVGSILIVVGAAVMITKLL